MILDKKYTSLLEKYDINTPIRKAHFFSQIEHESELKPISENLNYSSEGLTKTFKKYFPTIALCNFYARNPEKIANRVYANRMGNGNESSGDGWKYRGRGFIQITGKENYAKLSKDTGIDFVNNPDLLLQEDNAMLSALWFWKDKKLNSYADTGDIIGLTRAINGGLNGIEHRKELLIKWKSELL